MSKKLLMIVNPAAGKGKGRVYEQRVSALYTQAGWDCDIRNTQGAGDAARFALQEGAQADMLLCIGGDGTLSETLGGSYPRRRRCAMCPWAAPTIWRCRRVCPAMQWTRRSAA